MLIFRVFNLIFFPFLYTFFPSIGADFLIKELFSINLGNVVFPFDVGTIVGIIETIFLLTLVLYRKNLLKNWKYWLSYLLAIPLAFFWSIIGGSLLIAFMSTRPNSSS